MLADSPTSLARVARRRSHVGLTHRIRLLWRLSTNVLFQLSGFEYAAAAAAVAAPVHRPVEKNKFIKSSITYIPISLDMVNI